MYFCVWCNTETHWLKDWIIWQRQRKSDGQDDAWVLSSLSTRKQKNMDLMSTCDSVTLPHSRRLYSSCLLAQTQMVTLSENWFVCPKMWLPHPLWKTQGFCAAIPVTPYLFLNFEFSNTFICCLAGFSLSVFLFVLDDVFQPATTSLHSGINYKMWVHNPWDLCSSVLFFTKDITQIFCWNWQKGDWSLSVSRF